MPKDKPLSPKQEAFCREYLKDLNGTQAAIRAGYSPKTANEQAARLLANVSVRSLVESLKAKRAEKVELKAEDVIRQVARMALVDPRKLVDEQGETIPLHLLSDEAAAAIQDVEIKKTPQGIRYRYRLTDRNSAADKLMRHLGQFEKDNRQGADAIATLLAAVHGAGSRIRR